jgi:AAA domain
MKISSATCDGVPIVLIYGGEGRSKTTLACKFPKPVAMLLERGLPRVVSVDAIDALASYNDVLEALRALYQDPQGYQTLIIDTLDSLEPMLLDAVCAKNGWKNIESPSYGEGFVIADQEWQRFIRAISALRDKGMTVVMVAHSTIERFDDPRAPSYTAYWPKLHKRARHLILDACDVVGFLAEELRVATDDNGFRERTRATSSNQRFLFVEGCPAFVAKNRYGMAPKIPIPADFAIGELTKFWSQPREGEGE